jgi:hypothetical protein
MHTLASRGLAEIVIAEGFQVFLEFESKVHDLWKGIPFRRVEIKNEVVRFVEMRTTAMNVMQFDGRVIGKPHKTGIIGGDDVVDLLPLCPVVPDPSTQSSTWGGSFERNSPRQYRRGIAPTTAGGH